MKLEYDEPISNVAFHLNLRRYSGVRETLSEVASQVRGLSESARRAAKQLKETEAGNGRGYGGDGEGAGVGEGETTTADDAEDDAADADDTDEMTAAVAGLGEALYMCREAETLAAEAQARVADYAAALRADPLRRMECTTRLRELDRLCRALAVGSAAQACVAAEAGHVPTPIMGTCPPYNGHLLPL